MSPGDLLSHAKSSDTTKLADQSVDPTNLPPPQSNSTGATLEQGFRLPGYRYLRQLGCGGSGLVYAAIQETLDREVAIKILNPLAAARPDSVERFRAEAMAIARLNHPGIVRVYEVDTWNNQPFLVMELLNGGTLADALTEGPLSVDQAADCLSQVSAAVGAAHAAGIIHRDLKPSNILLERADASLIETSSPHIARFILHPKVADFGLAKDLSQTTHTTTGALLGTPSFMAPEQASGDPRAIGPHTDVYALGATLYACLTGHPPFKGTTILETLDLARTAESDCYTFGRGSQSLSVQKTYSCEASRPDCPDYQMVSAPACHCRIDRGSRDVSFGYSRGSHHPQCGTQQGARQ
jgi:serine/threonine protein kinase